VVNVRKILFLNYIFKILTSNKKFFYFKGSVPSFITLFSCCCCYK